MLEYPASFEETMQRHCRTYERLGDNIKRYKGSPTDSSIGLCYELDRVFYTSPRSGIPLGKNGLSYLSIWRRSG